MMKQKNPSRVRICIFFVLFVGSICRASLVSDLESFKEEVQSSLNAMQEKGFFPGATLGIVLKDGTELAFASGWSDVEKKIPMIPAGRMFAGSAGKTFVAAVAMQLVQEGKLDLDKKVSEYLGQESWFSRLPNHKDLTIRMIMTHTGGLPRYVFKENFTKRLNESPDKVWEPEELLAFVFDDPPAHSAGQGWSYSDTDYIVLGIILEKITGTDFYSELERRILKPFALEHTSPSNTRKLKGLVTGYTGDRTPPFNLPGKVPVDGIYPVNPQFEWCGGGLITTSLDMARWSKILYEGKAFSKDQLDEMLQPMDFRSGQPGDQGYGLGVMVFKRPFGLIYGHGGMFPGYETQMSYFPKWGVAVTIQVNADSLSGKLKGSLNGFIGRLVPILEKYFAE
ncbi:serine hydrolase domain-containing protein [Acidobacteriota bacterium]